MTETSPAVEYIKEDGVPRFFVAASRVSVVGVDLVVREVTAWRGRDFIPTEFSLVLTVSITADSCAHFTVAADLHLCGAEDFARYGRLFPQLREIAMRLMSEASPAKPGSDDQA